MLEQGFQTEGAAPAGPDRGLRERVLAGLSASPKTLPCTLLYDARGSALFEDITRLPEYYPTRCETAILEAHAGEMVASWPAQSVLVEFGSGSSVKTEIILRSLPSLASYVAIDVSASALQDACRRLERRFPQLDIRPVVADFLTAAPIPDDLQELPRMGFFPGSTIGNFSPGDAVALLRGFLKALGGGARLIMGVDLKKDPRELERAYDDAAGVTAAFNLNILARLNRELGARFDPATFCHRARYDEQHGRIEMHLVSRCAQDVRVAGRVFSFRAGESIHTENSYKYSVPEFQALAAEAGWKAGRVWLDPTRRFSVHELVRA